jgi:flagellar basal body-associated protein FliL
MAHAEQALAGEKQGAQDAASAPTAPKKKNKKGKKAAGPSLGARLKGAATISREWLVDLFKSIGSSDAPTRRMSIFFFLSLFGVIALGVLVIQRNSRLEQERLARIEAEAKDAAERDEEAALLGGHEAADHSKSSSMLNLGQFTIALKPVKERPKSGSFVNMAEVELVAECDSKDTHDFLEENLAQARNQLNGVFLSVDREELLTREGKRKLKKRILELLNGWLPHGKVRGIYFSNLIVA